MKRIFLATVFVSVLIASAFAAENAAIPDSDKARQGYYGFDSMGVCASSKLSSRDQAQCSLQMDSATSDEVKSEIRKKFEARLVTPASQLEPSLPSHDERVKRDLPP